MERTYFIKTDRIGFSKWNRDDIELARTLWGNPDVTKFICASGHFSEEDIQERLAVEIGNEDKYQVQYWPIFELNSNEFIGCCGLRPYKKNQYEMGFHLLPEYWGGKSLQQKLQTQSLIMLFAIFMQRDYLLDIIQRMLHREKYY